MTTCTHKAKVDMTHGLGDTRNWYCPCGWHKYQEKEYSRQEWEDYINEPEVS